MSYTYTTGSVTLPDIGTASYNGCTFSSLFISSVSGNMVQDNANRTIKYVEYTLVLDGYVTLDDTSPTTDGIMEVLQAKLSKQGGVLTYNGKGFGAWVLNQAGSVYKDVAWGPVPKILEFQPLGASSSAKIVWQVVFRFPEYPPSPSNPFPVLQFNEECTVSYDDEGYSTLSIKGTLEIPQTRITVDNRTVPISVDSRRSEWLTQMVGTQTTNNIDLTRFKKIGPEISISRDRRTMEWSLKATELTFMPLPPFCTAARGRHYVKNVSGPGLMRWSNTLTGTYTVAKNKPRRLAFDAFLSILRWRMNLSQNGNIPPPTPAAATQNPSVIGSILAPITIAPAAITSPAAAFYQSYFGQPAVPSGQPSLRPLLFDFQIDEGLYEDARNISFTASWTIITTLSHILVASGIWQFDDRLQNFPLYANSVVLTASGSPGSRSWLGNQVMPDVIVDFGG